MSSVKNDNPLANLWNATVKEAGRAANEAGKLVTESIDSVGKAMGKDGVVGATIEAAEKFSPGNMVAGAVDTIFPGEPLPKWMSEGISSGVNLSLGAALLGSGNPIGAALVVQGARDGFEAIGAATSGASSETKRSPEATRPQTPERPQDAKGRSAIDLKERKQAKNEAIKEAKENAKEAALEKAKEKKEAIADAKEKAKADAREKAQNNRIADLEKRVAYLEKLAGVQETKPNGGYADTGTIDGPSVNDLTGGFSFRDSIGRLKDNVGKLKGSDDEISKILDNPNLSFEDMIFMLMNLLVKQQQAEVKEMVGDLRKKKSEDDGTKTKLRGQVEAQEAKVAALEHKVQNGDKGAVEALGKEKSKLNTLNGQLSDHMQESSDSRSLKFEEMKNAMNKLTEMQQALSNILNNMHQSAMSTIGNIR